MYTMYWKVYKPSALGLLGALFCVSSMQAQTTQADSLFLTVDQLFDRGVRNSLLLQADALKEKAAGERTQTARSAQLPDLQVGLKGGYVG